ncbi:MAG: hypothetical protein GY926_19775 [bacterium]|nr:hypothetical protein [bacterium]
MTALTDEINRLTEQLADLGLDLPGSLHPGLTRDEIQAAIDTYMPLPPGVGIPEEVFEWHTWQGGIRRNEDYTGPAKARSIGPGGHLPMPLVRIFEIMYANEDGMLDAQLADTVIPLFAQNQHLHGYRLAQDHTWHISRWSDNDDYDHLVWSNPAKPETHVYDAAVTSEYVALTDWMTELNNAIADGRLIRHPEINAVTSSEGIHHSYPWGPSPY